MYKIAITGVIGAGKSTMGRILVQKYGRNFISADALAKKAICPNSPGYFQLLKLLGPEYLGLNNCFDTQKIAQSVFRTPLLLYQIESIIHPIVRILMQEEEQTLRFAGQQSVFYEIPLLFEKQWERLFETRIVVAIEPEKQKKRLQKYRRLSPMDIKNRMRFQIPQEKKIKKADHVIWNNSSLKELEKQIFLYLSKTSNKDLF